MLKGYEDVVWERLVRLYPEKRETLARAETPTSLDNLVDGLPEIEESPSTAAGRHQLIHEVAPPATASEESAKDTVFALPRLVKRTNSILQDLGPMV